MRLVKLVINHLSMYTYDFSLILFVFLKVDNNQIIRICSLFCLLTYYLSIISQLTNYQIIIISMMPFRNNFIKSQEFQLKLTENCIESNRHIPCNMEASLEYTISKISINDGLRDDLLEPDGNYDRSQQVKESQDNSTSTKHTICSVPKSSAKIIYRRDRKILSQKSLNSNKLDLRFCAQRMTVRPNLNYSLNKEAMQKKQQGSLERFRLQKYVSVKQKSAKVVKLKFTDLPIISYKRPITPLQNQKVLSDVLQIKSISLVDNDSKGKLYLKKMIQNRAMMLHLHENSLCWKKHQLNYRI